MTKINLLAPRVPPAGARRIPLTQGQCAFVDAEDFERINQHKWFAHWGTSVKSFYAARNLQGSPRKTYPMHREIFDLPPYSKDRVDHINRRTLDNRKSNLRIVSHRQNHENRKDQSKYGAGVTKRGNSFRAMVRVNNKWRYIGMFSTPEIAQEARRLFLDKHHLT